MAGHAVIIIDTTDLSQSELQNRLQLSGQRHRNLRAIQDLLQRIQGGVCPATVQTQFCSGASVKASFTVTCDYSSAVDGTDDLIIGTVTLSAEASPSGENQWDLGSSDATMASNLADAINGHSTLSQLFSAATDGVDTVTVTALLPGDVYNQIALSENGNGMTLSASYPASGSGMDSSTVNSYSFGT